MENKWDNSREHQNNVILFEGKGNQYAVSDDDQNSKDSKLIDSQRIQSP